MAFAADRLSQQGQRVNQRKAGNRAQDQHGCVELRQQALLCLQGIPTPDREMCSDHWLSTDHAMSSRDKICIS